MILTDFEKELNNCIAARGYRSQLAAARAIGVSHQHFRSTMLGCPIVRPAAIKMLEALGYDVDVRLVRRLAPEEYVTSEQASKIAHRIAQIDTGNSPATIYRIRMGAVKFKSIFGSYSGKFRVSGKSVLSRYAQDDPTFESIPVYETVERAEDAINLYNDLNDKLNFSGTAAKTKLPKYYKVKSTILLLEKCELDKDGSVFNTEILRKYAAPCYAPNGDISK